MKRRIWPLLLSLLFFLSGCGGADAPPAAVPEESASGEPAAADAGLSATQLEAEPRPLAEEEILAAYYRAEEAFGWFELDPLPDSGEAVRLEGTVYRRVDSPGMEDLEALRTYLRGLFSAELTEQLLETGGSRPLYRDIDGALYVSALGRARDAGKGTVRAEVVQLDCRTYSLEISVDLLDSSRSAVIGLECWSFPFSYVDGRWVFTDFRLVC